MSKAARNPKLLLQCLQRDVRTHLLCPQFFYFIYVCMYLFIYLFTLKGLLAEWGWCLLSPWGTGFAQD